MSTLRRSPFVAFSLLAAAVVMPAIAHAQDPAAAASRPAVMNALLRDVTQVEEKMTALAGAIPEAKYAWRPADGVRSTAEVLVHVAADNWFLPTAVGIAAPAETGITAGDYPSVQAYEARTMTKAEAMETMRESFAHLRAAMEKADEAFLAQKIELFGSEMSGTDLWVLTTTHLHEHLGQMIAYARSNGVVPPWSR
ncbi:MAG TPA: DinB family protein [Longimicrobiales bacterium]|nr:DinB family protein [Longimicrobiales bacterium]